MAELRNLCTQKEQVIKTIPLTIDVAYLPNWGVWEGVRELVQNGKDAESETGVDMELEHADGLLRIANKGSRISPKALLLGNTSKQGKNLIGQFGEGLKLGMIALLREGRMVRIWTGGELWVPSFGWSEAFEAEILQIDVYRGISADAVVVEVEVTEEEWEEYRDRFTFLMEDVEFVEGIRGDILLDPAFCGVLFGKGIFINFDPNFACGYNYWQAGVDRDRKMIFEWDKKWETAFLWRDAVNKYPSQLLDHFDRLLSEGLPDLEGMDAAMARGLTPKVLEDITRRFLEKYGANAVPVRNTEQVTQLEHLGRKGVVVPAPLMAVIEASLGSLEKVQEELIREVVRTYQFEELNEAEQTMLQFCADLISGALKEELNIDLPDLVSSLEIVDFRSSTLAGQYQTGRVLISRRILQDRGETIATIIHELAHTRGADGEHGHVSAMEAIWKAVLSSCLKALSYQT